MNDNDTKRLSRLTAILTQLQTKRLTTATSLAGKFNVSIRTIYRDIRALEQAGIPITVDEGKGYSLMEGYRLPPIMFTESEANAFITAEKLVLVNKDKSFIKSYVDGVVKIKSVLPNNAKDKAALLSERVEFEQNSNNNFDSDFLSSIQIALTNFSVIKIDYSSSNNVDITKRSVEPFAVINKVGESWYLIAWCRLRKDFRLFRFDRIRKLEMTDDKFLPHKISLQEYLEGYRKNHF
jgi:predicted DNA-binding transcriptional regulator YafY